MYLVLDTNLAFEHMLLIAEFTQWEKIIELEKKINDVMLCGYKGSATKTCKSGWNLSDMSRHQGITARVTGEGLSMGSEA